jgi:hypothetical protein
MHRAILGAGVVIMEGLTNLGALPRRRVDFSAPFHKIAGYARLHRLAQRWDRRSGAGQASDR